MQDLILYLGNRSMTGTLVIERGTAKKSVSIKDGEIINAASNDPREYLGQFLMNFGHLTEDQLTKAFHTQAETKVFLGQILVMIGLVTEDVVKQVLAIKFRETVLAVCRWPDGQFRFARGVLPPNQDGIEVKVPLLDVQREAEFRDTVWDAMLQVFPTGRLALKILDEEKLPTNLEPGSLEARLFQLIREGKSIDQIVIELHTTDFHLYQRLYAMYRQQLIMPTEALEEPDLFEINEQPVGESIGVEEIIGHAREFLGQGQYAEAEALARRASELSDLPQVAAVLKEAEAGLLEQLRGELLTQPITPRLASAHLKLKSLDLTPQEKYLLSRLDGVRDLSAIIRASPVKEFEALKCFRRFLDSGLIEFDR